MTNNSNKQQQLLQLIQQQLIVQWLLLVFKVEVVGFIVFSGVDTDVIGVAVGVYISVFMELIEYHNYFNNDNNFRAHQ